MRLIAGRAARPPLPGRAATLAACGLEARTPGPLAPLFFFCSGALSSEITRDNRRGGW